MEDAAEDELAVFSAAVQSVLDAMEKRVRNNYTKNHNPYIKTNVFWYVLYQKTQNTVSLTVISKKII